MMVVTSVNVIKMMFELVVKMLSGQPIPPFVGGSELENTVVFIALIGICLGANRLLDSPLFSMLGGVMISFVSVFEQHVFYFPFLNMIALIVAAVMILHGYKCFEQV